MIKKWISNIKYYFLIKRKIRYGYKVNLNPKIDDMMDEIMTVGSSKIIVRSFIIRGTLLNGKEFFLWNGNHWYSWCFEGYISNDGWGNDSNHSFIKCIHPNVKLIYGYPSDEIKTKLRSYFLSINKNFFREEKEYDLISNIRNEKIESIIDGQQLEN